MHQHHEAVSSPISGEPMDECRGEGFACFGAHFEAVAPEPEPQRGDTSLSPRCRACMGQGHAEFHL